MSRLRTRAVATAVDAFLGEGAERTRRRWHAAGRRLRGAPRRVGFWVQPDDPYGYLLAQVLPRLQDRHGVEVDGAVVPHPDASADPRPDLRTPWAVRDCRSLAAFHELDFPADGPLQPEPAALALAAAVLVVPRDGSAFVEVVRRVGAALWAGDEDGLAAAAAELGAVPAPEVERRLREGAAALASAGHYQGGMLSHEGEWYWGVDRIGYLDGRLAAERKPGGGDAPLLLRRPAERWPGAPGGIERREGRVVLDLYFSFRSPYSYLAAVMLREQARRRPVHVEVKPVLPMVMRGMAVPRAKRLYIVQDVAREARRLGVPFGRICDPVGVGVERCLALVPLAREAGGDALLAFLAEAGRGIWSEAIDVATDEGLRWVAERAGLDWTAARAALADEGWRDEAESNRQDLFALGLWGVPSFRLGDHVCWGQDRLWMLEHMIDRCTAETAETEGVGGPAAASSDEPDGPDGPDEEKHP